MIFRHAVKVALAASHCLMERNLPQQLFPSVAAVCFYLKRLRVWHPDFTSVSSKMYAFRTEFNAQIFVAETYSFAVDAYVQKLLFIIHCVIKRHNTILYDIVFF